MQGNTHLAFGTVVGVVAVGVAGAGLASGVAWRHVSLGLTRHGAFSWPDLHPVAWLALAVAAALGGLLPDIDQPGSLITRLPARETRALDRAARRYGRGVAAPTRLASGALAGGGGLLSRLLGGDPGGSAAGSMLYVLLACCAGGLAAIARWLPPPSLLQLPVQARDFLALALVTVAACALLLAFGGVAGLIHRLPGHHRGWTHAPPLALALTAASFAFGPILFPALPGVGAAFAAGYLSHLVADALTIRGIPLWWPGHDRPSLHLLPRSLRVRTGSAGEGVFNVCWLAATPAAILLLAR